MRIAVVGYEERAESISQGILNSLRQAWPEGEFLLLASARGASVDPRAGVARSTADSRRARTAAACGQRSLMIAQGTVPTLLEGVDLAISTSPFAASQIVLSPGTPHVCYLPPACVEQADAETVPLEPAARIVPLKHCPGHAPVAFHNQRDASALPHFTVQLGTPGVTGFIAASHGVSEHFRPVLSGSCPVIYPPVDTHFFRPGSEARGSVYLLIGQRSLTPQIQLAVEACQAKGRELMILGLDGHGKSILGLHSHVHCIESTSAVVRRHAYRSCRGVLVPTVSDFDPVLVEAQACGAPVIAFHGGAAVETLIDAESLALGTGIFFHEPTVVSLVSAISELERRPQKLSAALAWLQAARFSQARFEHEIRIHVQNLIEARKSERPVADASIKNDSRHAA